MSVSSSAGAQTTAGFVESASMPSMEPPTTAKVAAIVETTKTFISSTLETITTTLVAPASTISSSSTSSPSTAGPASSTPTSESFTTTTTFAEPKPTVVNVADLSSSLQHFGYVDYFVFILMLVVCAIIGFYFGFIEKKQKKRKAADKNLEARRGSEALDYLVGGRKMKVFPVSLSLVASFVSGISLLGTSTEIYVYGTQYAFILITLALSGVISWYVFLPVFCNLQLTSTYEYFEMRFDKSIRLYGSILFTIGTIVWLPIVIYVPALAFNQVTGVNIHIITPVVCIVCIFYTCAGGLKAVVWTDVIQTIIMVGAIVLVIIKGTWDVGGLGVVLQRNWDSGRIEAPEWTWDPTVRVSMLSLFVGTSFYYAQVTAGNQVIVQRYLSVPTLQDVKKCVIYFTLGVILLMILCFYNGLLIFATYHDCDPLTTKLAKAKDQLVPLLVMETMSFLPGMPGLFVAGVFSAALSSLSTGLNSLSAVFLEDYIKPLKKVPLTERQTAIVMRVSVLLLGVLCVALVFVVERLGTVLQLSVTLSSVTCGPLLAFFVMGLLLPWINTKSAVFGSTSALIIMAIICIRAQIAMVTGEIVFPTKPVTTAGCTYNFEQVISAPSTFSIYASQQSSKTWFQYIYQMSFLYYVFFGCCVSLFFAFLASFRFGRNDPSKMNVELFAPCIRRFIKTEKNCKYTSVRPNESTVINGFGSEKQLKK